MELATFRQPNSCGWINCCRQWDCGYRPYGRAVGRARFLRAVEQTEYLDLLRCGYRYIAPSPLRRPFRRRADGAHQSVSGSNFEEEGGV